MSPQEQFNNIVRNIKPAEQDLVPIIDIEHRGNVSEEQFIRDLTELIKKVEQYYGKSHCSIPTRISTTAISWGFSATIIG